MKILFVMDSPEYVRFYDSAFDELAARGHSVDVVVKSRGVKKPIGLGGLERFGDRVRALGVAPRHGGFWGRLAAGLRGTMDFVRYLHPQFSAASHLRARMKRKALPRSYRWLDRIASLPPGVVRAIEAALATAERAIPVSASVREFIREHGPDVVLVSPLVDPASEQVEWIKAARACGIPSAACVASWDNLTNKGLLRIEPDLVVVWNEAQRREAREYHYVADARIAVTGAQVFDRWFDAAPARDRDAFCARCGLPDARPFLLFTGSSASIAESGAEAAFVRRWVAALRACTDPRIREMNVLVRPHPYNTAAWEAGPPPGVTGVSVFPTRTYSVIDPENRADFFDALHYCAGVVGINTSAMIEALIAGRPVFSLLTPEFSEGQTASLHFRHLMPENGGCVSIAAALDEHIAQLRERLDDPDAARSRAREFLSRFVRPRGLERPATPVFVSTIERLASKRPVPHGTPFWAPIAWPVLLAAAIPAAVVDRLSPGEPRPRRRTPADARAPRGRIAAMDERSQEPMIGREPLRPS